MTGTCQELSHDGRHHACRRFWPVRGDHRLRLCVRASLRRITMGFDYAIAALVVAGLLVYLTYALLRPERF